MAQEGALEELRPATVANAPTAPLAIDHRTRLLVFAAILLAAFPAGLDQTIVGTALPRIVTDLQGADRYVWAVTAYLLTSTVTVPIYGKFSDVYGRRAMFMIGIGLFLFGSLLSGLSQSMDQLIAFRAIQGLGAGGILPVAVAATGDLFTPRERGRYQGMFGAVFGLSFLVGPFVGGWITDNINWHWVFYVNLPFGLVAMLAIARLLPNRRLEDARARDFDYVGIVVFAAAMIPLLIGLTDKGSLNSSTGRLYDWSDPNVAGLMGLGVVLLILFVAVEIRARHAIIPIDLFANRDYTLSIVATLLFGISGFVPIIFMPRFYQTVIGTGATASGFYIWPLVVGTMAGSIGSGVLITRVGSYKWLLAAGGLILVAGAFLMTHVTASTTNWSLWPWMLVLGLGVGPSLSGFTVVVQSLVPMHRLGAASSTLSVIRLTGGLIGLEIAGTVFSSVYRNDLPGSLSDHGIPPSLVDMLTRLPGALQGVGNGSGLLHRLLPSEAQHLIPQIVAAANDAFATATGTVFWVAFVAGLAALLSTLALRDAVLKQDQAR